MPLRWLPRGRRLTLTGTTGTRYLYSTGQALTVQEWSSLPLPRGDLRFITLYNCTEYLLFSHFCEDTLSLF